MTIPTILVAQLAGLLRPLEKGSWQGPLWLALEGLHCGCARGFGLPEPFFEAPKMVQCTKPMFFVPVFQERRDDLEKLAA